MIKAIIFDVDGVLLDSFESNFEWFCNLMRLAGYRPPTKEEYAKLFHLSGADALRTFPGISDNQEFERIWKLRDVTESKPPVLRHGSRSVLEALGKKYKLGIVTNRVRQYAFEPPLDSLKSFFRVSIAFEDTEKHKPDPEPLWLAAKKLGIQPNECVYVGDAETDLLAARSAGMQFVLFSRNQVSDVVIRTSDFAQLPELIDKLT
jgi:N-acetyl-D-muramate 6-phosphate phosphatase